MAIQRSEHGARSNAHQLAPAVTRYVRARVREPDVDDVLQEVWLRAHRSAGSVRDESAMMSWVLGIARNVVTDYHRASAAQQALQRKVEGSSSEDVAYATGCEEANDQLREELQRCMLQLMHELSPDDRDALVAADLRGLTQAELADRLGLSLSGAKSRVQRARQKLRAVFDTCCVFDVDCRGNVVACRERG